MAAKLAFALQQYAILAVFAVAAYGLGGPLAAWTRHAAQHSLFLSIPLQVSAGLGVMMVLLFVAGVLDWLNAPVIAVMLLLGLGLAGWSLLRGRGASSGVSGHASLATRFDRIPRRAWWWMAFAGIAGLPLLIAPLSPPMAWDELAYHLPYARLWAEGGALTVDPWLRYPLSAYNLNLLYAAALALGSDVLTHLLHALTGALTAALTFGIARRFMDWRVGLVAVLLLVYTTQWGWSNAYVDLGIMLFWSAAFASLALRHAHGDARFSYLAAGFAGIAVGIKYQGLFYLPVFLLLGLVVERRPGVVFRAACILAAIGGYWYLRNYWISGDPVHPIGGSLFGFWLWDEGDLAAQYADLEGVRGWRDWLFLPALAAPLLWRGATAFQRGLMLVAAAALAVWVAASGYWRYAVPVYPMLAILSGWSLVEFWSRAGLATRFESMSRRLAPRFPLVFPVLALALVAVVMVRETHRAWDRVLPSDDQRAAYLAKRLGGYDLMRSLGEAPVQTPYQLGFEGEVYYLGRSVRGDWFGPGRYTDTLALTQDAGALSLHLRGLGADGLLVNLAREPFASQTWDPRMPDYFELVGRSDRAVLYRLRDDVEAAVDSAGDSP